MSPFGVRVLYVPPHGNPPSIDTCAGALRCPRAASGSSAFHHMGAIPLVTLAPRGLAMSPFVARLLKTPSQQALQQLLQHLTTRYDLLVKGTICYYTRRYDDPQAYVLLFLLHVADTMSPDASSTDRLLPPLPRLPHNDYIESLSPPPKHGNSNHSLFASLGKPPTTERSRCQTN